MRWLDHWSTFACSASLLALALGFLATHVLSWRAARRKNLPDAEHRYHRAQFIVRTQATLTLAVLALALLIAPRLDLPADPRRFAYFWLVIASLATWILASAMFDAYLTWRYASHATAKLVETRNELRQFIRDTKTANKPSDDTTS